MTKLIGVIAEEQNDVDVLYELFLKAAKKKFSFRSALGHGSGKVHGKCLAMAENLWEKGCRLLVVMRDSDGQDTIALCADLRNRLTPCSIKQNVVVLPVHMIEAWLIADEGALRKGLNLRGPVKKAPNPEAIADPKGHISRITTQVSKGAIEYVHTLHNKRIAAHLSLTRVRTCKSFGPLDTFIKAHLRN